ncbi:entericidin A/B family lipoprotein [bacterium]|nr:entericidin A/B family lipoprotein [bacterium]
MKKIIIFGLLITTLLLVGCNTMHGIGKDIEKAGETIQKSTGK